MADHPVCKSMTFTIYEIAEGKRLPGLLLDADVFSRKVRAVLSALKKADQVANAKRTKDRHRYFISELAPGSAVVGVTEFSTPMNMDILPASSVDTFIACAEALKMGDFERAAQFDGLPAAIHAVAKGAAESFSHIDLVPEFAEPLRVDSFFEKQVERFLSRKLEEAAKSPPFFRGTSYDAFDGTLKEVDLRGAPWSGLLVLSGSGIEINCTMKGLTLEEVKRNLDMRVWAEGLAIYSEESGLPERLEISRMRPINTTGDLRRWRGKVSPDETRGDEESDWLDQ
jgi:hypothetical protein